MRQQTYNQETSSKAREMAQREGLHALNLENLASIPGTARFPMCHWVWAPSIVPEIAVSTARFGASTKKKKFIILQKSKVNM